MNPYTYMGKKLKKIENVRHSKGFDIQIFRLVFDAWKVKLEYQHDRHGEGENVVPFAQSTLLSHKQCVNGWSQGCPTIGIKLNSNASDLMLGFSSNLFVQGAPQGFHLMFYCMGCCLFVIPGESEARVWSGTECNVYHRAGTTLILQLDMDTGRVRLRVNDTDYGVIYTLLPGFPRPLYPTLYSVPTQCSLEYL